MEIVKEVYKLTKSFPNEERYGLVSQINRAAVSIPSNIAEGMGRNHNKDTIQFLHISRGSAYEIGTLLSVARMVDIIDEQEFNNIDQKIESSIRLINGFIKYLEQKN